LGSLLATIPAFDVKEQRMAKDGYAEFEALNPFFAIVLKGLRGLVDGEHFFEAFSADALLEFRYEFPGWPAKILGRKELLKSFAGYGDNIKLHAADNLVVHRCQDHRVTILEYQVHGKIAATGGRYDNRFISVITIEKRKIVHWVDYMDSLAAWKALNNDAS
jgi:ketosteroid isomerase-like protein